MVGRGIRDTGREGAGEQRRGAGGKAAAGRDKGEWVGSDGSQKPGEVRRGGKERGARTGVGRDGARRGLGKKRWKETEGGTGGMWGRDHSGTARFLIYHSSFLKSKHSVGDWSFMIPEVSSNLGHPMIL